MLEYPFTDIPAPGKTIEVAPGVFWLRMPLPMSLDHINLYLLESETGWTVVDTGIRGQETKDLWLTIFEDCLGGKPVEQIICTHMHPDHTGQTGFISDHFRVPLLMSYGEYYQARMMHYSMQEKGSWHMSDFFLRGGISQALMDAMSEARSQFAPEADDLPMPKSYQRLRDGDQLRIGAITWDIIVGSGHSPEHVCLYSKTNRLLLSGDQILPIITSNVSVHPTEPEADPMTDWLTSHQKFKALIPDETLILPAHNNPFYGASERLDELTAHHEHRMQIVLDGCKTPTVAIDLLPALFERKLENHTLFMALGEGIAHIHCLMTRGQIKRELDGAVYRYTTL
ncbi:MBL fold metallo-hydrolase [Pseudomonadales bacterium]|jgi:glyoxylase-like metal-dependent hydrolase (beta-lactamase superfamily II)|nr:MBL fold metallo-hydrolase [Gammaproteobacteria bacterium]MDA8627697.1 MBL fold metallo-hydrolase [Pseudomonadales bacterium]MBT5463594.1 MBL fold metallo-hydrolase [Gammaproteobacteria bacterium]MBT7389159.1 MBL fold metallo-hydrolase [Gammaproteobacteria bacterium]MCH9786728.1 MBL fold metallo-hydrolase [Gammaproteobacteria bacterium]